MSSFCTDTFVKMQKTLDRGTYFQSVYHQTHFSEQYSTIVATRQANPPIAEEISKHGHIRHASDIPHLYPTERVDQTFLRATTQLANR